MSKKIMITGATGFLGNALSQYLTARGHEVMPLPYRLGDVVDSSQLSGADTLIHCAWDMKNKKNNNVAGTIALAAECKKQNIHFIFISSMAAHSEARSNYGREKLAVDHALSPSDCIIRPATIIGNGGLFAKTCALAKALPLLPLFYSNTARLQTIYINDLCTAIHNAVEMRSAGVFNLAYPTPVSIKEFYKQIAALAGKNPGLIKLPGDLALAIIVPLEKLGLKLPITSDNLYGLKYGFVFETVESCRQLGIEPVSLSTAIQKMRQS